MRAATASALGEVPAAAAALHALGQDHILPMAPEFAAMLRNGPHSERTGRVFVMESRRYDMPDGIRGPHETSKMISRIGRAAGIVTRSGRHASAHDLRRSFGLRWAYRVLPPILMQLMRHSSIATTMAFYVGRNADVAAEAVWKAFDEAGGLPAEKPDDRDPTTYQGAGI